ncbi:MAG TPA: hypothetical protein VIG32_01765 [Candidatus Baltobacteraceae bacterium]
MGWARTLRVDAPLDEQNRTGLAAALREAGAAIVFGPSSSLPRTYALLEAGDDIDPDALIERIPGGRLYDEAIIALAIEPSPVDALRACESALGGRGRPAGIAGCDRFESTLVLEVRPSVTPFALVSTILDIELRRTGGTRRTQLLSPLPLNVTARIAADGLQAPEIAADRVLEALLARADAQ